MTMNPIRTLTLAAAIAVIPIAGAQQQPTPATPTAADSLTRIDRDWSHTHLALEPAFREQIERTRAFLDTHENKLNTELARLKSEGIIYRGDNSQIRGALDHIRGSISRITESIETNQRIDGWAARMVSYELGIAADTLAQRANEIDARLKANPGTLGAAPHDPGAAAARPRYLVKTLEETSNLMKETGQTIVHHIQ